MIVKCHCGADPGGRWGKPALIFIDNHRKDGGSKYRCREHLSPEREKEIQASERAKGFPFR